MGLDDTPEVDTIDTKLTGRGTIVDTLVDGFSHTSAFTLLPLSSTESQNTIENLE